MDTAGEPVCHPLREGRFSPRRTTSIPDVLEASNGKDAVEICREYQNRIDLVMTDVVMPQMGGRELVERLEELLPDAKVLFMSGYTDDAIVHHGVLDQSMNYLEKPFDPNMLIKKVREVLDVAH